MGSEQQNALERRDALLFWEGLDAILAPECETHGLIDETLRTYLEFVGMYRDEYLTTEYEVARCSYKLLDSRIFATHRDYVRRQILYCLLQDDDPAELHLISACLLYDGKQHESTFENMNREEAFPRLLELIKTFEAQDMALHRILLRLLYEMSRINRIKAQELMLVEDEFILRLLQITETLSDDVSDPYHYPVIQVLLVFNEQFMVCAHDPSPSQADNERLPNKVITALADHGHAFKTFGENIILLLNRESETSLQLLILKLLYLLFTTPATYEYFYTNDLRVLVDVVIRNLLDLPHSATALRHTYLRVLHPLLAHTQLADTDNHYKREELRKVLTLLTGVGLDGGPMATAMAHFGATDETTKRLGARCASVPWLLGDADGSPEQQGATLVLPIRTDSISAGTHPPEQQDSSKGPQSSSTLTLMATDTASNTIKLAQTAAKSVGNGLKKLQVPQRPPPRKGSTAAKVQQQAQQLQISQMPQPPIPSQPRSEPSTRPSTSSGPAAALSAEVAPAASSDTTALNSKQRPAPAPPLSRKTVTSTSPCPSLSPSSSQRRARSASRTRPNPPPPRKVSSTNRYLALGATNAVAAESSLSVAAVATPRAKPGVLTPSLRRERGRGGTEEQNGAGEHGQVLLGTDGVSVEHIS